MNDEKLGPSKPSRFEVFGKINRKFEELRDKFQKTTFYIKYNKFFAPTFFVLFVVS